MILPCINCKKSRNGASRCQHLTETNSVWQSVICTSCCFCFDQRDCLANEMWPNDLVLVNHSWLRVFFCPDRQAQCIYLIHFQTKTPKKHDNSNKFHIFPPIFFSGTYPQKGCNFDRDFVLKSNSNELHWLWHHWYCNAEKINSDDFGIVGNCSNGWSLAPNTLLIKS